MGTGLPRSASPAGEVLRPVVDRWAGLRSLIRARLLIATLALPIGVLLRPESSQAAWWVLWWALLAVGVLSAIFWLGARIQRGLTAQIYAQLTTDLVVITVLSAYTGGRDSQFMLFFGLTVISGGLLGRIAGGAFAASGACAAILAMPAITHLLSARGTGTLEATLPPPGTLIAFLATVGMLSGVLGERVRRTRDDLEQTARELDRVRLDNDAILRHLTTGILTVDAEARVAYLNPAAEQMLGLRSLDVRGHAIGEALTDRLASLRDVVLESLKRRAPRARAELLMQTAAGVALPVGASTNLLSHEDGVTGVVAVFQNLTEVREMERRVRRNETLAEVGALAAAIAHELRNGLHPISGSAECLQRELHLEGENAVLMSLIIAECTRLNRFVTDLLGYSRDRDLALETLDLDEHLSELCHALERDPRRPEKVVVRYEPAVSGQFVHADREQIRQVWLNLATNALEAMPGGGTLSVRTRVGSGNQVVIEFADEGPGIAAQDLRRIGQPFFTTKEHGTGLGVPIALRIVERHGGTLVFDSEPGRGTRARVTLPAAEPAVLDAAA